MSIPKWLVAAALGGWALGLGIAGMVCSCAVLLSIPAIVLGLLGIHAASEGRASNRGMAVAGVVLARPTKDAATWIVFNIGDSRVYLLRDGILTQVSHDHSQVQVLVDAGQLTRAQARSDPRKNVVTRALGAGLDQEAVPEIRAVPAQAGDRLLVCSDGLSDELDDEALITVLDAGMRSQRTAEEAVAAALEAGGHDNITALVVDLVPEAVL